MLGVLTLFGAIAALVLAPVTAPRPEHVVSCAAECSPRGVDRGELYYIDVADGFWSLLAVRTEGGTPRLVTRIENRRIGQIVFVGSYVFFATIGLPPHDGDGTVARVPKKGGAPEVLAESLDAWHMQADERDVYVHTGDVFDVKVPNRIVRIDGTTGTVTTVLEIPFAFGMTLAGSSIVLTDARLAPRRMPKTGGKATPLAPTLRCDPVASRGGRVYCLDDRGAESGLFELALDGSGARRLADLPGFRASRINGPTIGFVGSTIVVPDEPGGVHLVPTRGGAPTYAAPREELMGPQVQDGGWIYARFDDEILRVRVAAR